MEILKDRLFFRYLIYLMLLGAGETHQIATRSQGLKQQREKPHWWRRRTAHPAEGRTAVSSPEASPGDRAVGLWTKRPFCVRLTRSLVQNKALLSSTQKCGCLCHFNWSVFVKRGLYLLVAWGLCLPSLVEAKWRGSCELSRCILRHFSFQYLCLSNSWASVKQAQEGTRPTGRNYT